MELIKMRSGRVMMMAALPFIGLALFITDFRPGQTFRNRTNPLPALAAFRPAQSLRNRTHPSPAVLYTDYGYVLQLNVRGQMTASAMNVLSMQCMVSQLSSKLVVVEPFVVDSTFGVTLTEDQEKFDILNALRLGDIYDWNSTNAKRLPNHQLASWEDFIENAPRDVILTGSDGNCESQIELLKERHSGFFDKFGFRVVRTACTKLSTLTTTKFIEVVYGKYAMEAISLVITSQTVKLQKLFHTDSGGGYGACTKGTSANIIVNWLQHSNKVKADADTYIAKYLGGNTNYISVMVRLEKFMMALSRQSPSIRPTKVKQAFKDIINKWSDVRKEMKIESTLVTVDVGKYGSNVFNWKKFSSPKAINMTLILSELSKFFNRIYDGRLSFTEWEDSFESVSSLDRPTGLSNYVGILQKELASRGRCLIQFGGGSFGANAAKMYINNRGKEKSDVCLEKSFSEVF